MGSKTSKNDAKEAAHPHGDVTRFETCSFEAPDDSEVPTLLELFTSEGCSSCPPADRWVSDARAAGRGGLVQIGFHVDYWSHLGWDDPLQQAAFTARQRAHLVAENVSRMYTPAFVADAAEWRPARTVPGGTGRRGARLRVTVAGGGREALVEYWGERPPRAHVAVLAHGVVTKVRRGENSGRTLRHDCAALSLAHADMARADGGATWTANVPLGDAHGGGARSVVAWVTPAGGRNADVARPLQVVEGEL